MQRFVLLFLLLPLFSTLLAQAPSLYFEKLTTANGLSNNKVNCILQDKRGFIWVGTDDGLNRYDGKNFLTFRNDPRNGSSVSGNIITDILECNDGTLWISTADGGISKYDYRLSPQNQFKQYRRRQNDSSSIPVNSINRLLQDDNGHLWLGSSGWGVLRFDQKKEEFIQVIKGSKSTVMDLCLDRNNIIWAGFQGLGIVKIIPADLSYIIDKRYNNFYAGLPHTTVSSLFEDKTGDIWFGSWDKIIYRYQRKNQTEESFLNNADPFSFQPDEILSMQQDKAGKIWMAGRYTGLQVYDTAAKNFYHYSYDVAKEGTIADKQVNCVYIDKSGVVWLGTNKGISINRPSQQQFSQVFLPGNNKTNTIYDFYENGDKLWIGTSAGLFIQQKESGQFVNKKIFFNGTSLSITKFFRDDDGTLYLGTNYSLFTYNPAGNTVALLPNTEKDKVMSKIIESRVVSIIKDTIEQHPVLMVLPYGHFMTYYDLTRKQWVSRNDSTKRIIANFNLQDNLMRKLYKSSQQKIWLATAKWGLGEWTNGSKPFFNYFVNNPSSGETISNDNIFDIKEDAKRNLWVSTYGGGLHYFNTTTKKFIHIPVTNNLLEGIETDDAGNVWMIGNGDIHKYSPLLKTYSTFQLPDLEKSGGVKGYIFKSADGSMYAAGNNYFIRFHSAKIKEERKQPNVYFTDFKVFNQSFNQLLYGDKIVLKHTQNYFTIDFSAPDFSFSDLTFSYKLEGADADWTETPRSTAQYSNLDGGSYIFKVRVTNNRSNWNEQYAVLKITIVPPFWKTWWFYLLCVLFATGIVYVLYRYRINELVKRQTIRNKIAQDLHDNVGSTLSSISVYSQVAKIYNDQEKKNELQGALEKISATSSEMISEMNDIVWAINPRNDNMDTILQRMESFAKPLLSTKEITFRFNYDKSIAGLQLEMTKRKDFYLIFKESINNALKYSECRHLEVDIKLVQHQLLLKITDDGIGFDLNEIRSKASRSMSGNGLKNLERRAKEMKGTINIYSQPGNGTQVVLLFPIP